MEGEEDTAVVDPEKCMGCGVCLVTCPEEALSLKEVRSEDFIPE
jgi:NAD-dependent dihydropyrimidine dehydrogenase PreA subunit